MEPQGNRHYHRPSAFDKMERLVREMQDTEHGGVPVRSQKLFLTYIPSAFMGKNLFPSEKNLRFIGYDLIEWLMERLGIEESEALNLANQICQHGYFFPVNDSKILVVKDDSSLYRFQSPYYWPWQNRPPDNVEYAIYLAKRTLRNKQRHGLEDYELEALSNLRKNLANKWEFITMQAEEQVRLSKVLKKADKIIGDSQERAYWRVHRPPPGMVTSLEQCPVPTQSWKGSRTRKRLEDAKREVEILKKSLCRTRVKVSQALDSMLQYVETYSEYDALISTTQPSNPWVSEDVTFWQLNSPLVEVPTERRVRRWALSMEELVSDPTGLIEFTNYLRKEYSHENIRFWIKVNDLRRSAQSQILKKVSEIFEEFLAPGAPCEINIDGKTMEKVHQEMKTPSRFTFDAAQEHVYTLLLKKDCYPRFIRSEYYKNLLATGLQQQQQKKRFFGFGPTKKKISSTNPPNQAQLLQQQASQGTSGGSGPTSAALAKRRGSDRSLSGSAHELAVSGVKDTKVPHSHSQSNLSDIPYRVKKPGIAIVAGASTSEDVCPWDVAPTLPLDEPASHSPRPSRLRRNSVQTNDESSSSDVSIATASKVATTSNAISKHNILTQQHTVDESAHNKRLHVTNVDAPRRASVSSVPTCSNESKEQNNKRKVASFEDPCDLSTDISKSTLKTNATESVRCSASSQQAMTSLNATSSSIQASTSLQATLSPTSAQVASTSLAPCAAKPPTINITEDSPPTTNVVVLGEAVEVESKPSSSGVGQQMELALAPLAEPDGESPASELPPDDDLLGEACALEGEEAKANDVCPWEDEDTCKVDTPFVKTYATLGYL